jgi:hypothetical protein
VFSEPEKTSSDNVVCCVRIPAEGDQRSGVKPITIPG